MNYLVVITGHIAQFEQYEAALSYKRDFDGIIFNRWGLLGMTDWPNVENMGAWRDWAKEGG